MLVTADDFLALKEKITDAVFPLKYDQAVRLFDRLISSIEPRLVITDAGGALEWFEVTMNAREALVSNMRGVAPDFLERVAGVAKKYWKVSGQHPQQSLNFLLNHSLKSIAEEDWNRVIGAAQREDAKTTAIAAGSVVEAIALDILERLAAPDASKLRDHINQLPHPQRRGILDRGATPSEWKFAFLLLALGPDGLRVLTDRTHDIGHKLRDWRNYVHPAKSRTEALLSPADGRLAAGFAEKVIEEVTSWHATGGQLVVP